MITRVAHNRGSEQAEARIRALLRALGIAPPAADTGGDPTIQQMTRKTLDDKARGANHQGIIARVKPAKQPEKNAEDTHAVVIAIAT